MNDKISLWRTSTFRLTAIFILIFIIASISLLAFITYQSSIQIQRNQAREIQREITEIMRIEKNRSIRAAANAVQILARRPGPGIYYLGDSSGRMLVGNVATFPNNVLTNDGIYTINYKRERAFFSNNRKRFKGYALVRSVQLADGFRLIVGRDIVERRGYTAIIFRGFLFGVIGIIVLSLITGGLTAMRVLKRIDSISNTSDKIMSGNLSERIPVTKRNDEYDRLATSLNNMLDRIELLMIGLKEVTDNVAHDLKTPLTRMRNKAEAALRKGANAKDRIKALEDNIKESDNLIRTFNALLLIARVEAGTPSGSFNQFDVNEVVDDIAELYAPVAEDAGFSLSSNTSGKLNIFANRELVGQALVNLVENAIKYASNEDNKDMKIILGTREIDGKVEIEVSDNGKGIKDSDKSRATERFVRFEKSRTEPGSGLGLSLVKAVAKLHKGELILKDNQPGLRAIIKLPKTSKLFD